MSRNKIEFFIRTTGLGFMLTEILVYIAVLSIVVLAISSLVLWSVRLNAKAKATREVVHNARRVMETMIYEAKGADYLYEPNSVFGSHPGQLSLVTKEYLPAGEVETYIDFYLCGTGLCLKKESQDPISLISDSVRVDKLVFYKVGSEDACSVQIELAISYKNPANRSEYQALIDLTSSVSLRNY